MLKENNQTIVEKAIKYNDEILEKIEDFGEGEINSYIIADYVEGLTFEDEENLIEVIPANRKDFKQGILCTLRYAYN
ncbi:hypothetical protein QTH25_13105 [Clostridium perfringens]|uniref:hypothetical protein n=1 Tax=Clostridium perfringens TaxID=1502 RepID=UPI00338FC4A5|nr:hypothetical protein [Clostridium perfringens]